MLASKYNIPNCSNCNERSRSSPLRIEQIRNIVEKLLFNDGNSSVCFQLIPNSCFHFTMFDFSLRFAQTYQSGYGNKSPFNISSIIINHHRISSVFIDSHQLMITNLIIALVDKQVWIWESESHKVTEKAPKAVDRKLKDFQSWRVS